MAMAMAPRDTSLTLRLFVDVTVAEAYWQGGRGVLSVAAEASSASASLEVGAPSRQLVRGVRAWRMRGIWVGAEEVRRQARTAASP